MENDNQIAVKKRLIYAEDLFEPVDVTVYMGGRSGGKTMAMYEQLFRKRVDMAPTIDAAPVVHGRWEYNPGNPSPYCSHCGNEPDNHGRETPYCPNCGARMDLKEADHEISV